MEMTMDLDETIDAFRRGAIDLDCKKIVLSQHKEGGERFEGQGYIRQTPDGTPIFKLYVSKFENAKPLGHLEAQFNAVAGKLHDEDAFYDIEAVGLDGTRWTAVRILPAINWDMTDNSAIANGQIQSITARLDVPRRHHYLRLHFFEEYDVPLHFMSKAGNTATSIRCGTALSSKHAVRSSRYESAKARATPSLN
jgi:hypothetical protein